ncbi:glycosyltransferase family 1 protein [Synechococcus sp. PCC 7336]|uniref:glycosyltransferase family 4 protein n=1 Tax=Synechococcus sp. PCC 7336 TaxID=195250 RepID=UPI00034CFC32|nr:glycosyltransferase family 1 protein [Synechococcus sp. PCC 7336]
MNVLLVANYPPDRQESMRRFARMMQEGLVRLGHEVRPIYPEPRFAAKDAAPTGWNKWLGYIDKFAIFPQQLRGQLDWADVVHICDHSNAAYVGVLQNIPHVITCHDLLAIRGAWGDAEAACSASFAGKLLQRWILSGLRRSRAIACVSEYTANDARTWVGQHNPRGQIRTILNALNHNYRQLPPEQVEGRLSTLEQLDRSQPFLLHVGSNLPRKNRDGLLKSFADICDRWSGNLVFAGAPLNESLSEMVQHLQLSDRVVQVPKPSNDCLEALYNRAFALLFPSKSEGFGWPAIEAQACGCPVICSDRTALPEVVGEAGMVCPIDDRAAFGEAVLQLCEPQVRSEYVRRGLENVKRFEPDRMVAEYVALYEELTSC